MEIIAIANQKGGVGKTTTAVNLAAALHRIAKKKVLLIDLDSQGNATTGMGLDKNALEYTAADILIDGLAFQKAVVTSPSGLDVIGANKDLAGIDVVLSDVEDAPFLLKKAIKKAKKSGKIDYDFIIIDCAPSLSLLTVNAFCATQGVIIPMQCEYYALEGVVDLIDTIKRLSELNGKLYVRGVVRTMFDSRNTLAQDVSAELENHFGELMYQTLIPRNVRLAEAPSFGCSIFDYEKSSKGARAYHQLMNEILNRVDEPAVSQAKISEQFQW
ncbi:cobalamin biosynthesis protein CobQ [Moraxella caviae]|uniref:Cobalamin biosynthesis protein CobQ n=1 Tax=Moraxella caviae TaxID=34060 RepID=A0A1T0A5L6_9GAMM|nr:ParA family protein [Moraxella caviae]OOR91063.1 cobalamin biosynthesis protein CobQ [Moraxella caviae]STZ14244.1 Sporulation initiation inhibitor protein soj [Moraxella caviae]VEW13131.1 Sporulation initiation inhibitor protein soj [Moraxella caviae]VEW13180.1 Sporulation initiation inhibitor protein soj [Moraxella caviae]